MKHTEVIHPTDFTHLLVYLINPNNSLSIHLLLGCTLGIGVTAGNRQKFLSW